MTAGRPGWRQRYLFLKRKLDFDITPQPDDRTCGPACLHAVYRYYDDEVPLDDLVREVPQLPSGGTLAVLLALHALGRGYEATIYTCDLQMFDPSWFVPGAPPMRERLIVQQKAKEEPKLREAIQAYVEFLDQGGRVYLEEITVSLIEGILAEGIPIITGLSATWLYHCMRERPGDFKPDDAAGVPVGHFVVIHGMDRTARLASIADPYRHHPYPDSHFYEVHANRLIGAIMLGIMTFDAKLLVIRPRSGRGAEQLCRS